MGHPRDDAQSFQKDRLSLPTPSPAQQMADASSKAKYKVQGRARPTVFRIGTQFQVGPSNQQSSALSGNPFFPSSRSFLCSWLHTPHICVQSFKFPPIPKKYMLSAPSLGCPSSRYFNPTSSSGVVHRISFCLAHYTHHPCFLCSQCSYVWSLVPFNG